MKKGVWCFILLLVLALVPQVYAEDQVIINSKHWQDVYSGNVYALLSGIDVHYIIEEAHGLGLKEAFDKTADNVLLLESAKKPVIFGYEHQLAGYNVETVKGKDTKHLNLELAKRIAESHGTQNFVIVDDDLGYTSVTVASYALLTNSYVLFADKDNVDEVEDFLLGTTVDEILMVGHIDRVVKDSISVFDPIIIDNKDKYVDNIELVKQFAKKRPNARQLILTNGEFLEQSIFNDEFPVLLIGTSAVPQKIIEFIKSSDMKAAVIVGYELGQNALLIRQQTGLERVLLKYGQGRGGNLFALDIFPVPSHNPVIDINDVRYNIATKQLEVVYENIGDVFTFVQTLSHRLEAGDEEVGVVGDEEAFFLGSGEIRTVTYDIDLTAHVNDVITYDSTVILGDTPGSLEKTARFNGVIEIIEMHDESKIKIVDVIYNTRTKRFVITLENTGEVDAHAATEIVDMLINDEEQTIVSKQQEVRVGKEVDFEIKQELDDVDIADNPEILVKARYGEREDGLIKVTSDTFPLRLTGFSLKTIASIAVLGFIIWFLIILIKRQREDEEDE